jgi:hypothetical protein
MQVYEASGVATGMTTREQATAKAEAKTTAEGKNNSRGQKQQQRAKTTTGPSATFRDETARGSAQDDTSFQLNHLHVIALYSPLQRNRSDKYELSVIQNYFSTEGVGTLML